MQHLLSNIVRNSMQRSHSCAHTALAKLFISKVEASTEHVAQHHGCEVLISKCFWISLYSCAFSSHTFQSNIHKPAARKNTPHFTFSPAVFLSGVFCSCTNADYIQQASRDQRVQHFAKFTYSPGCHDDMFAVRLMWQQIYIAWRNRSVFLCGRKCSKFLQNE